MIQAYFNQIKVIVDQYAVTRFVLDANVSFETRPGDQGYFTGSITFVDGSVLYFREFLDAAKETVDKLTYIYHYQDAPYQDRPPAVPKGYNLIVINRENGGIFAHTRSHDEDHLVWKADYQWDGKPYVIVRPPASGNTTD